MVFAKPFCPNLRRNLIWQHKLQHCFICFNFVASHQFAENFMEESDP